MNVPEEIKKRMEELGRDFANKEARVELHRLIDKYLHPEKHTV